MNPQIAASDSSRHLAWIASDDNPARYSAIEEACLRNSRDSFLILWINKPSLFVGKNQNLWAEVSAKEAFRTGVSLNRRLSGGGTVYHDPGNLNFSFISNGEPKIAFDSHLKRLLPYFEARGLPVEIRNRSDLFLGERKFSGNAEYFTGGRVLHHGTLLFSTDLAQLSRFLTPDSSHYSDRAVDSNRSQTLNLQSVLPDLESTQSFARDLLDFLLSSESDLREVSALPDDILRKSEEYMPHFTAPEWVFGRSPKSSFERRCTHSNGELVCRINVTKGRISAISLSQDQADISAAVRPLIGDLHTPAIIGERLRELQKESPIIAVLAPLFLELFF
tara:strand:- start:8891 stop:9892 length:1002 start_codon:yes stop_codon:yes gene_type:complete